MSEVMFDREGWHKSSYSNTGGQCVEVREHQDGALVRDTQNRDLGALSFQSAEWAAFLQHAKHVDR